MAPPVPPSQTLYISNLPSAKIQKEDIRTALYMLFSTHGAVLDVVALKTEKMRGQAHIVYRDVQTATQAMRSLDGTEFFGRPLQIAYARGKSHIISKLDGSFRMPGVGGAAQAVEVSDLQQTIFNAPVPGAPTGGLPSKPLAAGGAVDRVMQDAGTPESRGQKRTREEEQDEEESDSDVAMEEDSDDE